MKRLPLIFSLLGLIALSASVAFWFLKLYKPETRPMAAIVEEGVPEPQADAGATLFGGQVVTVAVSNYQLTGVVSAGAEGVAILMADGQAAKAVQVGKEIATGVVLKEVHPKHVVLSEGGIIKRIELATDDKAAAMGGLAAPVEMDPGQQQLQQQMQIQQQQMQQQQMQQQMQMQQMQQQQMQQGTVAPQELPGADVPVPPNQPMEVPVALPPGVPAPPPPVQMPAPTRSSNGMNNNQMPTQ
ncbi:hypothetical protein KY495_07420 [Massilia sp. PAMC28688]|uniref:type II secretion system protein N n=1 Tax=Massilia sp. PAMC28688 TaxID=2861283 RepID=UPI001C62A94A|nr:type II secretion system protein N [Massilia sp. PAMC28688]QYF94988.1 hypothetical protein KY495_07420 [Massilia sp. PAMC28688]